MSDHKKEEKKEQPAKPFPQSKIKFNIGDKVHLKHDDLIPMTVIGHLERDIAGRGSAGDVRVCWIDTAKGDMHKDYLPAGALEHFPPTMIATTVKTPDAVAAAAAAS